MRFWREKADAAIARLRGKPLFNPSAPEFHSNPYPFYHRLRSEDPVHHTETGFWVVTRYPDVVTVLRDPRFGREDFGPMVSAIYGEDSERVPRPMVFRDPPAHTRLRSLVSKAFTSRVVQGMRPHIQEIVDRLLDRVQDGRTMDVISELAYPLPVTVICEMLGVPEERPRHHAAVVGGHRAQPGCARAAVRPRHRPARARGAARARRVFPRLVARAPSPSTYGLVEPTDRRGGARRQAERGRAARDLRADFHRRARDHGEPDRQRALRPAPASGSTE